MRKLICLFVLAACEIQPAPPRQAAVPPPPTPKPELRVADAGAPEVFGAPVDAGVAAPDARPLIEVSEQCLQVGVHVAGVVIASADPAQRTIFERERERIVRSTAEVCTTQGWSDAANKCYLAAKTQTDLKACETKFPAKR